jgi:hypothetical protein
MKSFGRNVLPVVFAIISSRLAEPLAPGPLPLFLPQSFPHFALFGKTRHFRRFFRGLGAPVASYSGSFCNSIATAVN